MNIIEINLINLMNIIENTLSSFSIIMNENFQGILQYGA